MAAATGTLILGSKLAATTIVGSITLGSVVGGFVTSLATSFLMSALTPKPKFGGAVGQTGYNVTANGSGLDHQIIYGRAKLAGARVFDATTGSNNKFLHRVVAFSGHEIEDFEQIYINDALVTNLESDGNVKEITEADGSTSNRYDGLLRIKKHLGSDDQVADADLVAEVTDWTSEHRLRGISYLYIRMEYNQDKFPNGIPEITSTVKGKKVYDPRTGTTYWSNNPALCLRDYISSTGYGLGEDASSIDDDAVSTAANVCEYFNYPTLSGDPRFTCNGGFLTSIEPMQALNDILSSMGGLLWYSQGKWRQKPAYWTAPTVSLNEDDLRGSLSVQTRHSRRDNFNTALGTFRGAESNWQTTDFPPVTNNAFVAADNNEEVTKDIALTFTDTSTMARRIANIFLERNRQQVSFTAPFGMKAFQLQVGDVVSITNSRFGWTDKAFEVTSWTFGLADELDLQVTMTLNEISESVYDDISDGIVYERDNTTLPSPFFVPPVGVNVQAVAQVSNEKVTNKAEVQVTATEDVYIDKVEVQFKLSSSSDWKSGGSGPVGTFEIVDLEVDFYDFRARAVNVFGVRGDWETLSNREINAFIGDPSDVSTLDKELSGGSLFLAWPPIIDADLSYYEIKHNSSTSGAVWSNSTTIVEKVPRPASSITIPARSGTFLIRAYDKEGNFSENPTTVTVLPSELPQLGQTDTATEDPTFSGSKTNVTVVSSALEIDDTSAASPEGTYEFANVIDTSSSRTARVTGVRTFTRAYDNGTLLWDAIPQNWDTWPDNWDTWTDEDAGFGDVGITVYTAATDDDPSGSPTWGAWVLANGAEITGRAFKFKAELTSDNTDFTPNVTALSATVEY